MKKLLMLNLGNYFVTTKGGFCPQRIKEYSTHFDKVYVLCLGNQGIKKFNLNTKIYSGNIIKWIYYFSKLKKEGITFVKIQDYSMGGVLGVIFSKILKAKLVMRCGGTWEHKNNSLNNILKNLIIRITKSIVLKNVSKIVFNSEYVKNKVLNARKIKKCVVYNGVDKKRFYPIFKKKIDKKLIYVGRVRKDKGLLYLRDAMKTLKEYSLTIVGEGPLKDELSKEKNIKCIGKINHDEIPNLLREHDIFIFPTLPESSESFPSSVLEAMACGLPIIATNVAGIPEMMDNEKNCILIKPYSVNAIEKAIKDIKTLKISYNPNLIYNAKIQLKKLARELFEK